MSSIDHYVTKAVHTTPICRQKIDLVNNPGGYIIPTMDSIRVDVDAAIPTEDALTVIATHARDIADAELIELKKSVQLNALRFGINHVEMRPKTVDNDVEQNSIWLRVPYHGSQIFTSQVAGFFQIATALHGSIPSDEGTRQARLDIYRSSNLNPFSESRRHFGPGDPFGQPSNTPADPFGTDPFGGDFGESTDPFGSKKNTQQFADVSSANRGVGNMSEEVLASEIERHRKIQLATKEEIDRLQRPAGLNSDKSLKSFRELAKKAVESDFDVQLQLQRLEIAQMNRKLVRLKKTLNERSQPVARQKTITDRIESILRRLP